MKLWLLTYISFIAVAIILTACSQRTFVVSSNEAYRSDADAMIASGRLKVQETQTKAVRTAIAGDNTDLQQVRNGRSLQDASDDRVTVQQLSPNMRLYSPKNASSKPRPLLLYLHGGGWCFGSIMSCSRFCTELCANSNIMVAALDYRLAPEYPFPCALDDCTEALQFLVREATRLGIDTKRISVGGDSSGGNLAIVSALQSNIAVHSLLLFYPVTNICPPYRASWQTYSEGYGCDAQIMEAFADAYVPATERSNPLVSPLLLSDTEIARLPRTLLVAAQRDVLYDQGKQFVERLHRQHVPAKHVTLTGTIHLFITVPGQDAAFWHSVELAKNFLRINPLCYGNSYNAINWLLK